MTDEKEYKDYTEKEKEDIIKSAKMQLKTKSKRELINIIINLSSKIDELKNEKVEQ